MVRTRFWQHARVTLRKLAAGRESEKLRDMSTVTEVESALEKLTPEQMREVADWIAARVLSEETPEVLAAIDEGLQSLRTEPTLTAEEVRRNIGTSVAW